MGAGNPLLKNWTEEDTNLYCPTTYFIDLSLTDEQVEKLNKEEIADEEEPKTKEIFEDLEFDNFKEDFSNILCELNIQYKRNFETTYSELTSAFREQVTIFYETKNLLIVSAGGDINHFSFGFIPNFKYDDIFEDFNSSESDKEEWYEKRNLSFYDRLAILSEKEYEKRLKKFYFEMYSILDKILEYNPNKISERNGPWLSSTLDKEYQKEIKQNIKKYKRWK